jgi:phosphoribosylamine--glycine ligase
LKSDLVELIEASVDGRLAGIAMEWSTEAAVCVVMASAGYPGSYAKGKPITGLNRVAGLAQTKVFHAGTVRSGDQIVTNGGRVLGVTAWGADLRAAQAAAYRAVELIQFEGAHYRRDIAAKAIG